jgi:hypothetical protein
MIRKAQSYGSGFFVFEESPGHNRKEKPPMALKLIATYSKRLGLPGYSSHQFSVCVETEISNNDDVAGESSRLYQRLQKSVDEEIQHTGFVPDQSYGISEQASAGTFKSNGASSNGSNGHHSNGANGHSNADVWKCSDKQRELILKLVEQHDLDKQEVEQLSNEMFGATVKELNKLQASGLIDRMLENYGGQRNSASRRVSNPPRRQYSNGGAR